jgi:arginine repressor
MSKNILDVNEINTKKKPIFSKRQLLNSKKYQHQKDLLNAILENDKSYSLSEVDKLINDFMKKKVNN